MRLLDRFEILLKVIALVLLVVGQEPLVSAKEVSLPAPKEKGWIDRFGQNSTANYPGKIKSELDLNAADDEEAVQLKEMSLSAGKEYDRNQYGGWRSHSLLKATGFFRTEEVDGRWWLVDPDGHLYYSSGIDCVGLGHNADLKPKVRPAYSWLPPLTGEFAKAVSKNRVNFYYCNLIRKWGRSAEQHFVERSLARMQAWGFTCLGNWSDESMQKTKRIPYTSMGPPTWEVKVPFIASDICDVYHPHFEAEAMRVARVLSKNKADPWLVGYFVDNELPWYNMTECVLMLNDDAPAKRALMQQLTKKYRTIDDLNKAWGTHAASFEMLKWPGDDTASDTARADMSEYLGQFAERFYSAWYKAIKAADPHHLVLGSRLCDRYDNVIEACARHSDVVSFNAYELEFDRKKYDRYYELCHKPLLLGEYGFDSLDAGLLAAWVPVKDQKERGERYKRFSEDLASTPYFVGAHYFQYIDEPLTGRSGDQENYFNGFVTVVDYAYPELVKAARAVNSRVYEIHAGGNS